MKISTFFYTIKQGFSNLFRNKWYTLASIATMSACLLMLGVFYSVAANFQHIVKNVEEGQGFVRAPWCDETACELEIKEKTGITTRCMPLFEDFDVTGCTCVHCGKPAKKIMYFGKSY